MAAGSDSSAPRSGGDPEAPSPDLRDENAFEAFYREHYGQTRAFFLRRNFPRAEAEELAQTVFQEAWRKRAQYRGDGKPGAWLSSIVATVWKNELRRRSTQQRQADEQELDAVVEESAHQPLFGRPDPLPDEQAVQGEKQDRLRAAVAQLPTRMRSCIELHLGGSLTYQQIADTLGVALGTVQSQIHDAKKRLAELMAAESGDLDGSPRDG